MMSESIAVAINLMISQSDIKDAMRFINVISDEIPLPSVVNNIIFNILMKNCKESIANEANAYLHNYLLLLESKSHSFRYDYRGVLQDISGVFGDIWSVFSHLVKSSFIHYKISSNKEKLHTSNCVKHPNCDILLEFYAKMITKFLSVENDFFDDSEDNFLILLQWINSVYKLTDQRVPILEHLHLILDKKLNREFSSDTSSRDIHAHINLIFEKCPDVFNSAQNMKGFFAVSKLPCFQVKICQHKLYQLIYNRKLQENSQSMWTLKTILNNYFFHNIFNVEVKKRTCASKKIVAKSSTKRPKHIKERFFQNNITGQTSLHQYCHKNQYGDLYEVLLQQSLLRPNVRNSAGRTPLHEACLSDSYFCVQFLLEDLNSKGDDIDLKAADNFGLTPLHCAAYVDAVGIAQMLLKREGAELVKLKDKFGEKAVAYAKSKKMKDLLESYGSNISDSTSDTSSSDSKENNHLTVPTMKDKEEYSIFLYGLFTLLSHYLESFNLYGSEKDGVEKLSHKRRKCPHYVSDKSAAVCDEDVSVFLSLPQTLSCFFACVQNDTKEINVNVRMSLLPLIVLGKSLPTEM